MKSKLTAVLVLAASTACAEEKITYSEHIRPLWEQRCSVCHGEKSPYLGEWKARKEEYKRQMIGPRMDSYAELLHFVGWPQTGALMRQVDDGKGNGKGKPGGMYQHLGDNDAQRQANLELLKQWVGPAAWTTRHWEAKKDMPAITKEELDRVKALY